MVLKNINIQIEGVEEVKIPKMMKVQQIFDRTKENNIENKIISEMKEKVDNKNYKGKKIAITVGSRGIVNIDKILLCIIKQLKQWGAKPFIVPAMGSHGGATASGQKEFIEGYGITEDNMGVPILSSMDVVQIGTIEKDIPIYCDKAAYNSDGIIVINKIKPHADFKADHESGIVKMMAIGLGKHKGATALHSLGFKNFYKVIPEAGEIFINKAPIAFGIAILENSYDEIMLLEVLKKENILKREKELLKLAKKNIAKLLLSSIDVLIIDEIGKNISGEGMDPNVTGRPGSGLNNGFDSPNIQKIFIRGITKQSHGNGAGIGMADISTIECIENLDLGSMYTNSITATILNPSKIPIILNNDKEALLVALKTCTCINHNNPKIVRIKNTLELDEIEVSEAYIEEIKKSNRLDKISSLYDFEFDEKGKLL